MRDAVLAGFIALCLAATLRYPFVGILTWAWFSLMTPHQLGYGVFGLPLNVIIATTTIGSILLSGAWRRFALDRITLLLVALSFWIWMSQIFSLDPANSAIYFDRFVKQLLFALLCVQMVSDRLRFHALLWMLVVGIGYFALKGALFTLVTLGQFRVQGVPNTILEDNNHMGIAIATILPLILYLRAESAHKIVRWGLTALFASSVVAVIGTHSRGAFVALVVFAGFFWLRSKRKLSILAALTILIVPAVAFMPSKWTARMETIANAAEDASFMGRVDAWTINAKLAAKHPLTGAGLRNSYQKEIAASVDPLRAARAKAAHSIYFEMLGGTGIVGLSIYLALLGTAFLTALGLHLKRSAPVEAPWIRRFGYHAQMALVVFAVGGATVSLEMWDGYLALIALIAAASRLAAAPVASEPWARAFASNWRVATRGRARRARAAK